jgi:hypothetical protein
VYSTYLHAHSTGGVLRAMEQYYYKVGRDRTGDLEVERVKGGGGQRSSCDGQGYILALGFFAGLTTPYISTIVLVSRCLLVITARFGDTVMKGRSCILSRPTVGTGWESVQLGA